MSKIDWDRLTKKRVSDLSALNAQFVVAPRETSKKRLVQLIKHYLPKAPLVIGISKEAFVVGFENQPQFKMLDMTDIEEIVDRVAESHTKHALSLLNYSQHDLTKLLERVSFKRVLLVNGSWKYAFHNLPAAAVLKQSKTPYKFISPFASEVEAREYELYHPFALNLPREGDVLSLDDMFVAAENAAKQSYDYSFQTGAVLGRKHGSMYEYIQSGFNKVIPYQTYALHHGNSREKYESKPHDTNHYDTIHAEMMLVTDALKSGVDIMDMSLFVNLLPCPNCARTLSQTGINEIVYKHDHSDGYAKELLELCGKKVRKVAESK